MKNLIKKYPFHFTIIFTLLFIALILIITVFNLTSKYQVEILVAPSSAVVTIDGKTYKNGSYSFPEKDLEVRIEKEGFKTQTFTFNPTKTNKIYAYLIQNDGTYSWYDQHPEDVQILNTIGGIEAKQKAENYLSQHPIIEKLPIIVAEYLNHYENYTEYRIDGGQFNDCDTDFCLKITDVTGNNKEAALEKIKNLGYNPDDYQILYEYTPITPLN